MACTIQHLRRRPEKSSILCFMSSFAIQTDKLHLHKFRIVFQVSSSSLFIRSPVNFLICKNSKFNPMIRRGYDSDDSDFATAIAASAHAIHFLEKSSSQAQIRRANTGKQEPFRPQQGGSIRKASTKDTRTSSSLRAALSLPPEDQRHKETSKTLTSSDSKAEAWEKDQIAKIRKRYEKVHSEIVAWENEKKLREKHQMERKKGELQLRKSRNLKHYYSKLTRIDHIAEGARAQVEEKQKHEESIAKEKARKIRSTGKVAVSCFCL